MTWKDWNDEPVDWGAWLLAGVAVAATVTLLLGCSSRPPSSEPPPDAGGNCKACWDVCGEASSYKVALFCSQECNEICHAEGR